MKEISYRQRITQFNKIYDHFLLGDMRKALDRIVQGVINGEKILIFGYHDLEGIFSISALILILRYLNADVEYFMPREASSSRELKSEYIEEYISALGTNLIIGIGCGSFSEKEVEILKEKSIDAIFLKNSSVKFAEELVICSDIDKCKYPLKDLTTCGLVFKLIQAMCGYFNTNAFYKYLDLIMLGILSTTKILSEENKYIVEIGINKIKNTNNYGIKALLNIHNISKIDINSMRRLINEMRPTVNALGKMDNARIFVELFTTDSEARANQIAKYLTKESEQIMV